MDYEQDYDCCENYYSHAGYETLEGDIIRRLEEISKLSDEDRNYELGNLPQEIYDSNCGQYDMTVIEELINANIRNWVCS